MVRGAKVAAVFCVIEPSEERSTGAHVRAALVIDFGRTPRAAAARRAAAALRDQQTETARHHRRVVLVDDLSEEARPGCVLQNRRDQANARWCPRPDQPGVTHASTIGGELRAGWTRCARPSDAAERADHAGPDRTAQAASCRLCHVGERKTIPRPWPPASRLYNPRRPVGHERRFGRTAREICAFFCLPFRRCAAGGGSGPTSGSVEPIAQPRSSTPGPYGTRT